MALREIKALNTHPIEERELTKMIPFLHVCSVSVAGFTNSKKLKATSIVAMARCGAVVEILLIDSLTALSDISRFVAMLTKSLRRKNRHLSLTLSINVSPRHYFE